MKVKVAVGIHGDHHRDDQARLLGGALVEFLAEAQECSRRADPVQDQ